MSTLPPIPSKTQTFDLGAHVSGNLFFAVPLTGDLFVGISSSYCLAVHCCSVRLYVSPFVHSKRLSAGIGGSLCWLPSDANEICRRVLSIASRYDKRGNVIDGESMCHRSVLETKFHSFKLHSSGGNTSTAGSHVRPREEGTTVL